MRLGSTIRYASQYTAAVLAGTQHFAADTLGAPAGLWVVVLYGIRTAPINTVAEPLQWADAVPVSSSLARALTPCGMGLAQSVSLESRKKP